MKFSLNYSIEKYLKQRQAALDKEYDNTKVVEIMNVEDYIAPRAVDAISEASDLRELLKQIRCLDGYKY